MKIGDIVKTHQYGDERITMVGIIIDRTKMDDFTDTCDVLWGNGILESCIASSWLKVSNESR